MVNTAGVQITGGRKRVYINPGEYRQGRGDGTVYVTVLGSCVSVIFWHAPSQYFAFCHYLLAQPAEGGKLLPEGKFGAGILPRLTNLLSRREIPTAETWVALVGGASSDKTSGLSQRFLVGERNIRFAEQFLASRGLRVELRDVGGRHGRKLAFNSRTGELSVVNVSEGEST